MQEWNQRQKNERLTLTKKKTMINRPGEKKKRER